MQTYGPNGDVDRWSREQSEMQTYGPNGDMHRQQEDETEWDNTIAYGVPETMNREQQNDRMPENEGIVRKENPAKTEAGAAGVCTCGVCGSVNNPAHKYCIICGAVLQGTEKTPHGSSDESDTVYCPNCGMKNRMGGSYCINCGSRL